MSTNCLLRARRRGSAAAPLAVLLVLLAAGTAAAQDAPTVLVGVYVEKNYSVQPGLQLSYASPSVLGGRPRLTASYSTTRLATAMGSKALAEDRVQLGAAWHFRPARTISPYLAAQVGYTRFDLDDPERFALLDNDAPLLALLGGVEVGLGRGLRASGGVGYSPVTSSTVYPLVASVGVHYAVRLGGAR